MLYFDVFSCTLAPYLHPKYKKSPVWISFLTLRIKKWSWAIRHTVGGSHLASWVSLVRTVRSLKQFKLTTQPKFRYIYQYVKMGRCEEACEEKVSSRDVRQICISTFTDLFSGLNICCDVHIKYGSVVSVSYIDSLQSQWAADQFLASCYLCIKMISKTQWALHILYVFISWKKRALVSH